MVSVSHDGPEKAACPSGDPVDALARVIAAWHLSTAVALIHAADGEGQPGRPIRTLVATARGALSPFGGLRSLGNSVR
jgi:hypothetical protein